MTLANPQESNARTVGARAYELLEACFYYRTVTYEEVADELRDLACNGMFESEWERPVPPEVEKLRVGDFIEEWNGEAVAMYASCDTRVYFDEDGKLVFDGVDSNGSMASCTLNITTLLERARRLREQYDEQVQA